MKEIVGKKLVNQLIEGKKTISDLDKNQSDHFYDITEYYQSNSLGNKCDIYALHSPCCLYQNNTAWIIGITVAEISSSEIEKVKIKDLAKKKFGRFGLYM